MRILVCLCAGFLLSSLPLSASFEEDNEEKINSLALFMKGSDGTNLFNFINTAVKDGREWGKSRVPLEEFDYDPQIMRSAYFQKQKSVYGYGELEIFYTTWNDNAHRTYGIS
ncbi:MAG: hypothetical protein GY915_04725, partial [bacterium]|nr:hypothetical protein [bacterium]